MSSTRAAWLLLITAVMWSLGGVLIKGVDWHPLATASVRSAIAALAMALVFWRKLELPPHRWAWAAAVAYCLMITTFVASTRLTTAANAIFLQYTAPVWVALLATVTLGERLRRLDIETLLAVAGGVVLFFVTQAAGGSLVGNLLGLFSGMCFAAMVLCMRKGGQTGAFAAVLWGNGLVFLVGLPFIGPPWPTAEGCTQLAILGVFQLGLPYIIYTMAVPFATAMQATLIPILEAVLSPIWVFFFRGEYPGDLALLGAAIVVVALLRHSLLQGANAASKGAPPASPTRDGNGGPAKA